MTARALPEDSLPTVVPMIKAHPDVVGAYVPASGEGLAAILKGGPVTMLFPGGRSDTSSFVASHEGPTPSTTREYTKEERALAFLELAKEGLEEALDGSSAMGRKFAMISAQAAIAQALELLK